MEFLGIGIEHIRRRYRISRGRRLRGIRCCRRGRTCRSRAAAGIVRSLTGTLGAVSPVLTRSIVNGHTGFHVVAIDAERNARTIIFHGARLHHHTAGDQLVALEQGRHAIKDMVAGALHILGDLRFEGFHTIHIHGSGSGDEVAHVGVFSSQLISQQVAAVVNVLAVHPVVLMHAPAGRLHRADGSAFFGWHGFLTHKRRAFTATAQAIQGRIAFEGFVRIIIRIEIRLVAVQLHIRRAGILGNLIERNEITGRHRSALFGFRRGILAICLGGRLFTRSGILFLRIRRLLIGSLRTARTRRTLFRVGRFLEQARKAAFGSDREGERAYANRRHYGSGDPARHGKPGTLFLVFHMNHLRC